MDARQRKIALDLGIDPNDLSLVPNSKKLSFTTAK